MENLVLRTKRLINTYRLKDSEEVNAALIEVIRSEGDKQNRNTHVKATMTSWQIPINPKIQPYSKFFDFLHKCFVDNLTKLWLPMDYNQHEPKHSYALTSIWGVIYREGDHTELHNHFSAPFSFCYYLKMDDPPTPLRFESIDYSLVPTESTLVLFPGWMDHRVPKIDSKGERIVITGNFMVN